MLYINGLYHQYKLSEGKHTLKITGNCHKLLAIGAQRFRLNDVLTMAARLTTASDCCCNSDLCVADLLGRTWDLASGDNYMILPSKRSYEWVAAGVVCGVRSIIPVYITFSFKRSSMLAWCRCLYLSSQWLGYNATYADITIATRRHR